MTSSHEYDAGTGIFGVLTTADEARLSRMWSVCMGDVRVVVYADDHEHAVCEFEAWCIENRVERKGAEFLRGRLHDAD